MQLSPAQISQIATTLSSRIRNELEKANEAGILEDVLLKYDYVFEQEPVPVFTRTQKVLVLGAIATKKNHYIKAAKEYYGISEEHIEFVDDFSKLGRFNTATLRDSNVYSDVILGPVPHKQIGIGDNNSLLSAVQNEPHRYPRFLQVRDLSSPISKTEFLSLLGNTRYVETLLQEN